MLLDLHQRRISYLRLSLTDRCNLRCQYCMPAEGLQWIPPAAIMQDDEIVALLRDVFLPLGVHKIRLTGGEPTVRRGLVELVGRIRALPGVTDLAMTTNGIMFAELAERLKAAGLDRVNVSLDSLRPERYEQITRGGKLERVLRALDRAVEVGLAPVKVNVVVIPGTNDDEILDFAELTLARPIHLRFIEMMQVGDAAFFQQKGFFSVADIEAAIATRHALLPLAEGAVAGNGPARNHRIPGAAGTIGLITPMSRNFCHTCNRTRLTADGQIKACLMRPQEQDLLGMLRAGASPERLQDLVRLSMGDKPLHHEWGAGEPITRTMSAIGG